MNKRITLFGIFAALAASQVSNAAVTLTFSSSSATLNNIANSSGSAADSLFWGIVVDRTSSGFESLTLSAGIGLADATEIAPGFSFFGGGNTTNPPFGSDFPGPGRIGTTKEISPGSVSGITLSSDGTTDLPTGSNFALIWFDTGISDSSTLADGDNYGILENGGFKLPADNRFSEPYLFFEGEDPIRAANLEVIPEPSTALLGLLGALGLLRRRR